MVITETQPDSHYIGTLPVRAWVSDSSHLFAICENGAGEMILFAQPRTGDGAGKWERTWDMTRPPMSVEYARPGDFPDHPQQAEGDEALANRLASDRRRYRDSRPSMDKGETAEWYERQAKGVR